MFMNPDDVRLKEIFVEARTIAVVGLSRKPERDSYRVAKYMQDHGYRIIPVNPGLKEDVLGEKPYPDLASVPEKIDIVNVFRRSEEVLAVVDAALPVSPRVIWMQLGIASQDAAARAMASGVQVVMNSCIMVEHRRLMGKDTEQLNHGSTQ